MSAMEVDTSLNWTFITMHDLSEDAQIRYASHSITDVLGYEPSDVIGRSIFDFFDSEDRTIAKMRHEQGARLDKASVLAYCRLKTKGDDNRPDVEKYRVCECVFTVVYDVVVAATSIRTTDGDDIKARDARYASRNFAIERQIETLHHQATLPERRLQQGELERQPRYRMIRHLSSKFISPHTGQQEPRAALILNRFTKALNILYATHATEELFGVLPSEMTGRSFYECIQEDGLLSAANAINRAKENNSIAYLQFRWRDPRPFAGQRVSQQRRNITGLDDDDMHSSGSEADDVPMERRDIVVEAVVSCTSDGLVVVLRRSRHLSTMALHEGDVNLNCAAPWATQQLAPQSAEYDYMESIRQCAVFAWYIQDLNPTITQYARESDYEYPSTVSVSANFPRFSNSASSSRSASPDGKYTHHAFNGNGNHTAYGMSNGSGYDSDAEMN